MGDNKMSGYNHSTECKNPYRKFSDSKFLECKTMELNKSRNAKSWNMMQYQTIIISKSKICV